MKWRLGLILFLGLLTVSQVLSSSNDEGASAAAKDEKQQVAAEQEQQDFDYDGEDDDVSISDENEENNFASNNLEINYNYESPTPDPKHFYFAEHFDDKQSFNKKWIRSQARKDDIAEEIAKYDGEWELEEPKKQIWKNDLGLVLKSKAKHAAIASKLMKPFKFDQKPLVVQYEVTLQDGQNCGGSYLKLLSSSKDTEDLTKFNDKTPYTIMFGPDKCGNDIKLHFIFRHVNPINGSVTEKHCRKPRERLEEPFKDKLPHLYQLLLRPDNRFEIRVDHRIVNQGSLLQDFEPAVNPPKEINDPDDHKPEDWDEREKIPDPTANKPDEWDEDAPPQIPDPSAIKPANWLDDEEEMIPDPSAKKPDDWDTEIDGEWEAPLIENPLCENAVGCGKWKAPLVPNPDYKGKWRAPLIDNPNYQGKWLPKKIPNPDFFEDLHPFKMTTISAVGIELWSMSSDILFDNILITDDADLADEWAAKTFDLKRKQIDKDSDTFVGKLIKLTNDNPYLWGVYILVVGVPLTFVIYSFCCSKKEEKENAAKAKKTDAFSPDDEPSTAATANDADRKQEKNENENIDDDDGVSNGDSLKNQQQETETDKPNQKKKNTSPKSKKSDLEVENNENTTTVTATIINNDDNNSEKKNEMNEFLASNENIEEIAETEELNSQNTAEGARKRKPRKE